MASGVHLDRKLEVFFDLELHQGDVKDPTQSEQMTKKQKQKNNRLVDQLWSNDSQFSTPRAHEFAFTLSGSITFNFPAGTVDNGPGKLTQKRSVWL